MALTRNSECHMAVGYRPDGQSEIGHTFIKPRHIRSLPVEYKVCLLGGDATFVVFPTKPADDSGEDDGDSNFDRRGVRLLFGEEISQQIVANN